MRVPALLAVGALALGLLPASAQAVAGPATDLVSQVRSVAGTPQGFVRGHFGSSSLATRDWRGCDGLQRALISSALTRPRVGAHCSMSGGSWRLSASTTTVDGASQVRVIPVLTKAEAWAQGAFGWTPAQRIAFASAFPTARSRALPTSWSAAQRNCTITQSGASAGLGCAYAVVPAESTYGEDSLLSLAMRTPEALDCSMTASLIGTLVAWDLSASAPVHATLTSRAASCAGDITVARARTPMNMASVFARNPYLPGSTMLASTSDLLVSPAGGVVTKDFFGLHVLPGSGRPSVPFGTLRLWDAGVGWDAVQPRRGEYDWTALDRIVREATANGDHVMYTLGRTPWWAANHRTDPPRKLSDLTAFITALTRRYGDRIYAYEMWNEANLKNYFTGTPTQMAQMTRTVHDAVEKAGVTSIIIGASTTVRIMTSTYRFYPAYLAALRRLDWPVDAFAVHTYPRPGGGPDEHTAGIVMVKAMLDAADAPDLPVLDTEVNFGLGGLGLPKRDIDAPLAGAYVAQTFLEALRMGLSSVEWYGWSPRTYPLLGLQLDPATTGTNAAWTALHELIVDARFVGCAEQGVAEVCAFDRDGERFAIAYSPSGTEALIEVPTPWTRRCELAGPCSVIADARTVVGISPITLSEAAAS